MQRVAASGKGMKIYINLTDYFLGEAGGNPSMYVVPPTASFIW